MYRCNDCNTEFDEPKPYFERHDELEGFWCEEFSLCPMCGSDDFDEICDEDEDETAELEEEYETDAE